MASKFKLGDLVTFINDYGVKWPEKTVVGIEERPGEEPRYFLQPTDCPWFPTRESNLVLDADDPVVCSEGGHKIRYAMVELEQWFLVGTMGIVCRTLELATRYALDNPKH